MGWFLGSGGLIGMVYIRSDVAGGCNSVACKGGAIRAKKPKIELQELNFGQQHVGGLVFG